MTFDCAEGVSTTLVGYIDGQGTRLLRVLHAAFLSCACTVQYSRLECLLLAAPTASYTPIYPDYAEHGYVQLVYDARTANRPTRLCSTCSGHTTPRQLLRGAAPV